MKVTSKISIAAAGLIVIGAIGGFLTYKKADKEPFNITETAKADFTSLNVSASNAKITIKKAKDDEAKAVLTGDENSNRKVKLKSTVSNGTWTVSAEENSTFSFTFSLFSESRKLTVYLPEREYQKLHAETDNGKVIVQDIRSKFIHAESDNGRIDFQSSFAESIDSYTSNGRITFDGTRGKIKARTDNGRIDFTGRTIEDPLDFKTDNGRIQIELDEKPKQVQLDANTDNGHVTIFGQQSSNGTTIQGGGPTVKLRTDNGKIEVNAHND